MLSLRKRIIDRLVVVFITFTLPCALTACAPISSQTRQGQIAVATAINTPGQSTPVDANKQAAAAAVATNDAKIAIAVIQTRTAIALTPTYTPAPPEPTVTLELGVIDCVAQKEPIYWYRNCWRGTVNGQITTVAAGGERVGRSTVNGNPYGDPSKGVILVSVGQFMNLTNAGAVDVYLTPVNMGSVHIVSADGSRLSIAPNQPNAQVTWVFDVATRQFYTPSGTPVPSTATPAIATLTPVAP